MTVRAIDDTFVDGGDTQVFPARFHTVTGIRGPLLIDGAGGGGSLELPPVVLLPRDTVAPDETNQRVPQGTIFTLSLDRTSGDGEQHRPAVVHPVQGPHVRDHRRRADRRSSA